MLMPVVLPTIKSVTKLALVVILPVTSNELNVPTLVIFGCAGVDNVPLILLPLILPSALRTTTVFADVAVSVLYPSSKSAFRFVTLVVDATTIGAVPFATFDSNVLAITVPAVPRLPTLALPVTLNVPPVDKLPPVTVPVAVIIPAEPKLPTLALPVTLSTPPVFKFPAVTLPVATINPPVPKLAALALPLAFNVPVTLAPVLVTTNTFATPPTLVLTLPFATGISIFDVPLLTPDVTIVVQLRLPEPLVDKNCPLVPPVIMTLPLGPKLLTPLTVSPVSVPTLVIFGCAFDAATKTPLKKFAVAKISVTCV
jgi:hypothetical protein